MRYCCTSISKHPHTTLLPVKWQTHGPLLPALGKGPSLLHLHVIPCSSTQTRSYSQHCFSLFLSTYLIVCLSPLAFKFHEGKGFILFTSVSPTPRTLVGHFVAQNIFVGGLNEWKKEDSLVVTGLLLHLCDYHRRAPTSYMDSVSKQFH